MFNNIINKLYLWAILLRIELLNKQIKVLKGDKNA
jgi:hypothetical protein